MLAQVDWFYLLIAFAAGFLFCWWFCRKMVDAAQASEQMWRDRYWKLVEDSAGYGDDSEEQE